MPFALRSSLLALPLAAVLSGVAASADVTWDRGLYDPAAPVGAEMTVPMPCGGAMTMVRIDTIVESDDPLSDRYIKLGSGDESTGYLDYIRDAFVRGGFSDGGRSHFWLGKYEVTRDQYAAVMAETCPTPGRGGMRPANGMSWFEAVEFSRRLTEWVRRNAPDSLPGEDGAPGYFRLPTEAEWEYAARGGSAVDQAAFRDTLFPMDSDLKDYAWFAGRTSSNGSLRPIGMHKPNPLGLHGMLGGVEEFMLEPFKLNNVGRLHGQVGGFVTRGGSFKTEGPELRSSLRSESPYFSRTSGEALRDDGFGIRLVLAVHVNVSLPRTNLIQSRWVEQNQAPSDAPDDPLMLLDRMIARESERRAKNDLTELKALVAQDRNARIEAAERSTRLTIQNGAVLVLWMDEAKMGVDRWNAVIPAVRNMLADDALSEETKAQFREKLVLQEEKLHEAEANYEVAMTGAMNTLISIHQETPAEELHRQAAVLLNELTDRNQGGLIDYVDRFLEVLDYLYAHPSATNDELRGLLSP